MHPPVLGVWVVVTPEGRVCYYDDDDDGDRVEGRSDPFGAYLL